jgi:hypothetical protein
VVIMLDATASFGQDVFNAKMYDTVQVQKRVLSWRRKEENKNGTKIT